MQACRWFDPRPFTVEGGEGPFTAVEIYRDDVPFDTAVAGMTDPAVARTILRERHSVGGGRAVRVEVETTALIPLPGGTRIYAYIIDLGSRGVLVISTTSLTNMDYPATKRIVDETARTLRVF